MNLSLVRLGVGLTRIGVEIALCSSLYVKATKKEQETLFFLFLCSRIKKAKAEDKKCHAKTMNVQKVESDVSDE